ncbi:MAG TPA: class I SAM-dependent methyltransferase [Thermotogota bacterium]|nr:class I SAM-dependent methyltransferase [Thermotogota bacterium]HPJ89191.1 class I SAM-dependent methyltransferase [Thermotogota bacterium]HPR95646.1 class I SAM-dependent methyltransferase [Thermotogota bacterium]
MVQNKPWDWEKVKDDFWLKPSEDTYYLMHRWKNAGFRKFIDLGSGMGRHTIFFAENGFDATGFDLSEYGLKHMEKTARERHLEVRAVHGDVVDLPFEDNSFDCALAYHSVYHVDTEGMKKVVDQISRIIRPGGELYITFISKDTYSYKNLNEKIIYVDENVRLKEEQDGRFLPHYFVGYQEIPKLFEQFEVVNMRQIEDFLEFDEKTKKTSLHYFVLMHKTFSPSD